MPTRCNQTTMRRKRKAACKYKVGEIVDVKGDDITPWQPAKVVECGPKRIFKVTFTGWSTDWDDYVSEDQCQFMDGKQVKSRSKVTAGNHIMCLWGDGLRYQAKVLHDEKGLIRVLKVGLPVGCERWTPASEIKESATSEIIRSDDTTSAAIQYRSGDTVEVKVDDSNSWVQAKIIEVTRKRRFKVTYLERSPFWDGYVSENQCQFENGEEVAKSKVKEGDTLSCLHRDGLRYPAKVLCVDEGLVRIIQEEYANGDEKWIPASEIKEMEGRENITETVGSQDHLTSASRRYRVEITGDELSTWLSAEVVGLGPKRIFKVTYPGWSHDYDEYVTEDQCQFENGKQVTTSSKVEAGLELSCLWGDGSRYPAKVLYVAQGVICLRKAGRPVFYESWIPASAIKKRSTPESARTDFPATEKRQYKVGDIVEVKGNTLTPWLPAEVVEVGPKRIFRVTYLDWTNVYDAYIGESQCQFENGEQVTAVSKVEVGNVLKCLWIDGTSSTAEVLKIEEGVIRVLKQGYPPGFESWIPASEIKELATAEN